MGFLKAFSSGCFVEFGEESFEKARRATNSLGERGYTSWIFFLPAPHTRQGSWLKCVFVWESIWFHILGVFWQLILILRRGKLDLFFCCKPIFIYLTEHLTQKQSIVIYELRKIKDQRIFGL